MVYRREEQAKRVAYLFSCSALSGAFGGLLAYAILQMNGVSGIAGWRLVSGAKLPTSAARELTYIGGYILSRDYLA